MSFFCCDGFFLVLGLGQAVFVNLAFEGTADLTFVGAADLTFVSLSTDLVLRRTGLLRTRVWTFVGSEFETVDFADLLERRSECDDGSLLLFLC